ncbi:MAG: sulfite exporter TauE/SafE family protein [Rhodovarius sp.]|nr:sulfite exporter TauE/SafE family protein [Rhodovarius sp.]
MGWLIGIGLLAAAGWIGGLLAGLFGVGVGVVLVPAALLAAPAFEVAPEVALKLGLGTALALTLPTSLLAALRQHRAGRFDRALFRRWGPPLLAGACLGTWLAAVAPAGWLGAVFGVLALLIAAYLGLLPPAARIAAAPPAGVAGALVPAAVGGCSVMMGVGGGTLGVPAMCLLGVPIGAAVATAAGFGVLVSAPATVGLILAGMEVAGRPWGSLGWVSLPMAALLLPIALAATPVGVRLAGRLPPVLLRRAFALFMAAVGLKMLL